MKNICFICNVKFFVHLGLQKNLCPKNCLILHLPIPAGIYLLKVNNRNTRTRCEICSKLTIKTPEQRWRCSGVFMVNFEHISQLVLVFLLLTLNMYLPAEISLCCRRIAQPLALDLKEWVYETFEILKMYALWSNKKCQNVIYLHIPTTIISL